MKRIRIGNDLTIRWRIYATDGSGTQTEFDLSGRNLTLYVTNIIGCTRIDGFSVVEGNVIGWTFPGREQKTTGVYSLTLIENEGLSSMHTLDKTSAFMLTARTPQGGEFGDDCCCDHIGAGEGNVDVDTVELTSTMGIGVKGDRGEDGASAYEIAVRNGFEGSEQEWLQSLKSELTDEQMEQLSGSLLIWREID